MASRIEIFTDTNPGNLEQAINHFIKENCILPSWFMQSQSSYLIEDPDTNTMIPHTEITISVCYQVPDADMPIYENVNPQS